jgi:fido (protein-threonine AMPylation protein)
MISTKEIILVIGINNKMSIKDLSLKLKTDYKSIYKHIKKLETEDFVFKNNYKEYELKNNLKSKIYFSLLYFCFKNNIDYKLIVNKKTAKIIYYYYKHENLNEFNSRYYKNELQILEKFNFIYIKSKKPLKLILFNNSFLNLLVNYFLNKELKIDDLEVLKNIDLDKLNESLLFNYKKYLKYKNKFTKNNILINNNNNNNNNLKLNLIYNSLSLEGNTLTLPETEKILKKEIVSNVNISDLEQTLDYKKGIDFLLKKKTILNLKNILEFHKIIASSLTNSAGNIRKINVKIKQNPHFKTKHWKDLNLLLDNLFKNIELNLNNISNKDIFEIIKFCAYVHNEFQRTHPFEDGNSRTSRAIIAKISFYFDLPIINIPIGLFDSYMGLTKLSKKRDDKSLEILLKIVINTILVKEIEKKFFFRN